MLRFLNASSCFCSVHLSTRSAYAAGWLSQKAESTAGKTAGQQVRLASLRGACVGSAAVPAELAFSWLTPVAGRPHPGTTVPRDANS